MKKNEEKSAMEKKTRGRGRPRKIVQTMVDGSESSHDQYFPSSASLKYFVGEPSRYTFRSREVDNHGKEDEDASPIQNQNVSAKKSHKLNSKRKALNLLYFEEFRDDNLFSVRVDVEEDFTSKRAQKTSVANFKEMKSIMNPGSSRDVTKDVTTKCASIMHRGSLRDDDYDDDDDDDDDDEIEVGANVAENVIPECAENTSIACGLNDASMTNRGLRDVIKVDDDDETESSMHSVFGNVQGEGPDVTENVATVKTSIGRSFNVSEIANMMNHGPRDEDDEVVSSLHPISVNVKGYNVKQEVAPLLEKILMKYGDIGKNYKIRCANARGCLVEMMCSVYQQLEDTNMMDVTDVELEGMLANVNVLQCQNFDVKWLSDRVEDIRDTKNSIKEHSLLEKEKEEKTEAVKKKVKEVEENRKKFLNSKNELKVVKGELEKVNEKKDKLKEKGNAYWNKSLVHGLV